MRELTGKVIDLLEDSSLEAIKVGALILFWFCFGLKMNRVVLFCAVVCVLRKLAFEEFIVV